MKKDDLNVSRKMTDEELFWYNRLLTLYKPKSDFELHISTDKSYDVEGMYSPIADNKIILFINRGVIKDECENSYKNYDLDFQDTVLHEYGHLIEKETLNYKNPHSQMFYSLVSLLHLRYEKLYKPGNFLVPKSLVFSIIKNNKLNKLLNILGYDSNKDL